MAVVFARVDIVTSNGLTVARKNDEGSAVKGAKPHEADNWGKVLVHWKGRKHGYWCDPAKLRLVDRSQKLSEYVAVKEETTPYPHAATLPKVNVHFDYHFGENLKLVREARKLSQNALGQKMGEHGTAMAQSTICYRESRPEAPSGEFVKAAARALDVPPFILFVDLQNKKIYNQAREFLCGVSSQLCD